MPIGLTPKRGVDWKNIIKLMVDFYRRVWQAFLVAAPVLAGIAFFSEENCFVFVTFLILALVSFVVALVGLRADYVYTRKEEAARQAEKDRMKGKEDFPILD